MAGNDTLRFYYPWPAYGVKMSRQWPNVRENFDNLAPLVRAAYVDLQPSSAHNAGENDLSGWALGERDFRNRFRTWYDKVNNMFKIQYNSGTEAVPVWSDAIQIRESDLRVIIAGSGGIQSSVGGFYSGTPAPSNVAQSKDFTLSREWVYTHSMDMKPILWNTFRSNGVAIVPAKVDVSDRNIAYFYFNSPVAGTAIVAGDAAGQIGVTFTDGTNTWTQKTRLGFNHSDFYLTPSNSGNHPVLNIRGSTGGAGVSDHGDLTGLTDDDHSQYLLASQATDRSTFTTNWADLTDGGETSLHTHPASGGGGFYGIIWTDSRVTKRTDRLAFNGDQFYLDGAKPTVNLDDDQVFATVQVNQYQQFPDAAAPSAPATGNMRVYGSNASSGNHSTVSVIDKDGTVLDVLRDVVLVVANATGSAISAGKAVYLSGATGSTPLITLARADSPTTCPAHGVTMEAITNGNYGRILVKGVVSMDTSAFSAGDIAYLSGTSAGALTATEPTHPYASQKIGVVLTSSASGLLALSMEHADGDDTGTNQATFTVGPTVAGSVVLTPSSTAQRTVTFPDKSGTVAYTEDVGPGFYGVNFRETDGTPTAFRNDTIYFDSESFYLHPNSVGEPVVSFRGSSGGGVTDHGALTGLSDDDHAQYLLASDATSRVAFAAAWTDLTDGGATTLHSHAPGAATLPNVITAEAFYTRDGLEMSSTGVDSYFHSRLGLIIRAEEYLFLEAEDNLGINTTGTSPGTITIASGPTTGSDNAPSVSITGGEAQGTGTGGDLGFNSGASLGSDAGDIFFAAGAAGGTGLGGNITLTGGDSVSGDGGSITLRVGNSGSASDGDITVDALSGSVIISGDAGISILDPMSLNSQKITDLGTPTLATDAATKAYVDSRAGQFYGVNFRETDGSPDFRNDTIYFDSNSFYLHPNSVGKPVLSFRGSSGAALTVRDEDGSPTVSNVSTIRFTNGSVTDNGGGDVSISAGGGGGISTLTVGGDSFGSQTTLGLNASDFYLSGGATTKVLNLRVDMDMFQGQIPQPALENYFVVPTALHNYTVVSAELDTESGTATGGFYIVSATNRQLPGRYIAGMDPISISSARGITPAGNTALNPNTMVIGDRLVLSIYGTNAARHVTYTVKLKKT